MHFASVYDAFFKIWVINDLLMLGCICLGLLSTSRGGLLRLPLMSVGTPIFVLGLQSGRSPIQVHVVCYNSLYVYQKFEILL